MCTRVPGPNADLGESLAYALPSDQHSIQVALMRVKSGVCEGGCEVLALSLYLSLSPCLPLSLPPSLPLSLSPAVSLCLARSLSFSLSLPLSVSLSLSLARALSLSRSLSLR